MTWFLSDVYELFLCPGQFYLILHLTEVFGFIFSFLKKGEKEAEKIKAHYSKVETNIESITKVLEKHQETLLKDVAVQERLFENNKAYFKELTMYIAAGRIALDKA